jgi:hypothetical protein
MAVLTASGPYAETSPAPEKSFIKFWSTTPMGASSKTILDYLRTFITYEKAYPLLNKQATGILLEF